MRWDLLDKFYVLKKGQVAKAVKKFSGKEDFFEKNFPDKPLVPEALFIEMIAQAGGVLLGLGIDFKKEVILAKVAKAKFLREIAPPCSLEIEAKIDEAREEGAWISGAVRCQNTIIAEVSLMLVMIDSLIGTQNGKIVFNDTFLKHYDVYEVAKMSQGSVV